MVAGRLVRGLVLCGTLAFGVTPACSAGTTEQQKPASSPRKVALPEQSAIDVSLAEVNAPAAALVLSLEGGGLLASGGVNGADPARQALRPGSTVKPLTAWIAAEAGLLNPAEKVLCEREFRREGLHCFAAHGALDLREAITTSCNVYFFELATRLGAARISAGLAAFGLGGATGLIPGEASGFLATPAWAAARTHAAPGWELAVAAGHGPVAVTLIQLAHAYRELLARLAQPDAAAAGNVGEHIRGALRSVVAEEDGTGHRAAVAGLDIAGKTGTAEPGAFVPDAPAPDGEENGWFVGFAPADEPKTLVAAVVLGRGSARDTAAPLVGRIFQRLQSAPSAAGTRPGSVARLARGSIHE